jgi:hypothetical protein
MAVPGASGLLAQRPTAHGPTAPTQQIAAGAAYLADSAWPRPPPFFVCGRAPCQVPVPSAKKPPCGRPNTLCTIGYWPWPHAMPCGPASGGSAFRAGTPADPGGAWSCNRKRASAICKHRPCWLLASNTSKPVLLCLRRAGLFTAPRRQLIN